MKRTKNTVSKTTVGAVLAAYTAGKIKLLPGDVSGLKTLPKSMEVFGYDLEQAQSVAAKWDALTQAGRKALIRRDPSMRMDRFSDLVERMSCSQFTDLTPIQQDGVGEFWKFDNRGRYSPTQEIK